MVLPLALSFARSLRSPRPLPPIGSGRARHVGRGGVISAGTFPKGDCPESYAGISR
jgi:hypothetical protein